MLRRIAVASIVALLACATAQARGNSIPAAIRAVLNGRYPGWVLVEPSPQTLTACGWNENGTGMSPTFVWGDFTGDGRRDYAAEIDVHGDRYILALVRTAKGFAVDELSHGEFPDVLTTARAGAPYHDYKKDADGTYPAESPVEIFCEKAAIAYIFRNGRFEKVWVSD